MNHLSHRQSPDTPVPVRFLACFSAWRKARKGKKPSVNQMAFEARWLERLMDLHTVLRAGNWQPASTVCFVVTHPKTREIHAPDFADRVVHHILVERLEKLFEPRFIHDSYANRQGKGSHAAVQRLQNFMRRGQGVGTWYGLPVGNLTSQFFTCMVKLAAWHAQHPIFDKVTVQQVNQLHAPTAASNGRCRHVGRFCADKRFYLIPCLSPLLPPPCGRGGGGEGDILIFLTLKGNPL